MSVFVPVMVWCGGVLKLFMFPFAFDNPVTFYLLSIIGIAMRYDAQKNTSDWLHFNNFEDP